LTGELKAAANKLAKEQAERAERERQRRAKEKALAERQRQRQAAREEEGRQRRLQAAAAAAAVSHGCIASFAMSLLLCLAQGGTPAVSALCQGWVQVLVGYCAGVGVTSRAWGLT
jgi:Flp pilus assembly protein TadB